MLWKVLANIFQKKKSDWSISRCNERKKVKEGSSASSTDDTNVFGEGFESVDSKAILTTWKI